MQHRREVSASHILNGDAALRAGVVREDAEAVARLGVLDVHTRIGVVADGRKDGPDFVVPAECKDLSVYI